MKTLTCLLSVLLISASGAVHADKIFRWTDENGQVHFGSQPPIKEIKNAEKMDIKTQHTPSSSSAIADKNEQKETLQKKTADEPLVPASISAADAEKNCALAKNGREALERSHNTRFKQADGSYRPLTMDEREEKNKNVDDMINKFCS